MGLWLRGSGSGAVEEPSKPEPARLWAQRMCDLIGRCWDTEPAVRPTFECIVQELKRAEREPALHRPQHVDGLSAEQLRKSLEEIPSTIMSATYNQ